MANIPEWVKAELFEELLKQKEPNYEKILSFRPHSALAAGENYATIMLRVEIEIQLKGEFSKQSARACHLNAAVNFRQVQQIA